MDEFTTLVNEMYQQKVWSEVTQSFLELPVEKQEEILSEFAKIQEEHGDGSKEMYDFFHTQSMLYSKTYYFVHTLGEEASWDNALEELS